ncbi:hypothetical protein Ndes2526B_g09161 [Nannochloris sp. 'desiccata']|nr:hypothetical protein KSW81_001300 [Chlorella desiccata (nom. nud.)]KAH7617051.1 hypothetical protein NADE_001852 [Chlorella desiccata (nom. nud.)]
MKTITCRSSQETSSQAAQQTKSDLSRILATQLSSLKAQTSRRQALFFPTALSAAFLLDRTTAQPAFASKLPEAADRAWEAIGGGAADLTYPDSFLGVWNIESLLVSVDLPLGPEAVPDMSVVQRALDQDKNKVVRYEVSFIRNPRGQVVTDRRYNTASLMHTYLGLEQAAVENRITWNVADPNRLDMSLPGGLNVTTRVTRRLEEWEEGADRLITSEFFQQLIESDTIRTPKIKASQAYTKYKWRPADVAGDGPEIVATQVVSDYAEPALGDSPKLLIGDRERPVTVYSYKMAFRRKGDSKTSQSL